MTSVHALLSLYVLEAAMEREVVQRTVPIDKSVVTPLQCSGLVGDEDISKPEDVIGPDVALFEDSRNFLG